MKKLVFLIDGFNLYVISAHLKLFAGIARDVMDEVDVCICVTNGRPFGAAVGKTKEEIKAALLQQMITYYGDGKYPTIDVLLDSTAQKIDPKELFIRVYERFGKIDVLFVSSGFWRPALFEKQFLKLSYKKYFFKMGTHNENNIEGYDGILSSQPNLELIPSSFDGDIILRPDTSAIVGNISGPLGETITADKRILYAIKRLHKNRYLVTATKDLANRIDRKYCWLIEKMYKKYNGDIALLICGNEIEQAKEVLKSLCSVPIAIETFPYQSDLTRFYRVLRENCDCIYIHPNVSGGGYCKVLASLIMPSFIFNKTDSVQMHQVSLCSCKEEILYKCLMTFDDYKALSNDVVRKNKDSETSFLNYSRWLIRHLLEGDTK
ncbi:hypothetical protein [Maridesulfovibrio sp.]|uniref:hypothetical protein n=1 Tax=Maridesulfovibrio sp. TaxID=2795000 RepID=UPI0039EE4BF0